MGLPDTLQILQIFTRIFYKKRARAREGLVVESATLNHKIELILSSNSIKQVTDQIKPKRSIKQKSNQIQNKAK